MKVNGQLLPNMDRRDVLRGLVLLPLLNAATSRTASAATGTFDYYVAPNGLPANSGTSTSPWSIDQLTSRPEIAGKRVGLLDGTYVVPTTYSDNWGGNNNSHGLHITQAGSATSPTSIEAVNPGSVTLTPANSVTFSLITMDAPYIRIYGLVFDAKTFPAIRFWANYSSVDSCDFLPIYGGTSGDNLGAIYFKLRGETPVQQPHIRNCVFRGVYNSGASYTVNANAIMGFSVKDALIEYCTASNCFSLFRPKYDWFGYTIRNNFSYGIANFIHHLCVPATYSGRVAVYNNLSFAFSGAYLYESTEKAADADVYNNTMVISMSGPGMAIRWWKALSESANTSKFYNNIIYFRSPPTSGQYMHVFGGLSGVGYKQIFQNIDYNAYPSSNFSAGDGDLYTPTSAWNSLSAWRSASGFDVNSIQVDPGFIDSLGLTAASYQLSANSACRGAGRLGGVSTGSPVDLGCWTQGVTAVGANLALKTSVAPAAPALNSIT